MSIQQKNFKSIADKIREKTGSSELIKPSDFAEKIDEVFDTAQKSQYDKFWDTLQQKGNRKDYEGAFGGWHEDIFIPKYDIKPTEASYMFRGFANEIDMVEHLKKLGITLDFSNCQSFSNFLLWSQIKRLGIIDSRASNNITFYVALKLQTIDLLIIKDDGSTSMNFQDCNSLKQIVIQGVIGKNLNMQWCPLSKDSIISVVNALSQTTSNLTVTFKKTAVNNAFGINVDNPSTYPEGSEFYSLRNSKSNWTFSFV